MEGKGRKGWEGKGDEMRWEKKSLTVFTSCFDCRQTDR